MLFNALTISWLIALLRGAPGRNSSDRQSANMWSGWNGWMKKNESGLFSESIANGWRVRQRLW